MIRRRATRLAAVLVAAAAGMLTVGLTAQPAAAAGPNLGPVVAFARAQVGKPYVWGANGPDQWDCSSLVQAAYRQVGVALPRVTYEQAGAGWRVAPDQIQPGDLLFRSGPGPQPGHVGMFAGNGEVVEAKGAKWGTIISPLSGWHPQAIIRPSTNGGINGLIAKAAATEGLPAPLLRAQLWQESGFSLSVRSPAGAMGIAQFMPATWPSWATDGNGDGRTDPLDPADAIPSMAKMMAALVRANNGDVGRALAGYNAGQGAVQKYGGVPPFPETQNYVRIITANSGVTGRIELHPTAPPAPPIPQQIVAQVASIATLPSIPRSPADAVHDIAVGLLVVLLALAVLRKFAPRFVQQMRTRLRTSAQRAVRRASRPPRRPARGATPGYVARSAAAAGVRRGVREANRARALRRGTAYRGQRVWEERRKPRPTPQPRRNPSARPVRPSARTYRPSATRAGAVSPLAVLRIALAELLRHLRRSISGTATAPDDLRNPAAPDPICTGLDPLAGRPWARVPRPGSATVADLAEPSAVPPQRTPQPQRSTAMAITHPYDLNWREHLTDPGFEQLLKAADGIEGLDLSDGEVVAAAYMWATELLTGLSQGMAHVASEAARRGLAKPVHSELSLAADRLGDAADSAMKAEKHLFELHDTFFRVDISKPTERIGS